MTRSTFKQIVFETARAAGGRVAGIIEPNVTPNVIAARIELGLTHCYLLHSHADDWAFSDPPSKGFRHGMLEHHRLKLPQVLSDAFALWIRRYEDENMQDGFDTASFNAEGLRLATLLKQHLGPDRHVEYQGEERDGSVLAAVVIG